MASFIAITPRTLPRMAGGASPRRRKRASSTARNRSARLDPILDDGDVDQTSIDTYVSCSKCFNSIMLAPAQFRGVPSLRVRCSVCELHATVTLEMLEKISGEPFDAAAWRVREAVDNAMQRRAQE